MRWLVVLLAIGCRRDPEPPKPPSCVDTCWADCRGLHRSELLPCEQICSDRCSCKSQDLCECAEARALTDNTPMPAGCPPPKYFTLDAIRSDAAIQDAPDR